MEIIAGEGFIVLAQYLVLIGSIYGNVDISTLLPPQK